MSLGEIEEQKTTKERLNDLSVLEEIKWMQNSRVKEGD